MTAGVVLVEDYGTFTGGVGFAVNNGSRSGRTFARVGRRPSACGPAVLTLSVLTPVWSHPRCIWGQGVEMGRSPDKDPGPYRPLDV